MKKILFIVLPLVLNASYVLAAPMQDSTDVKVQKTLAAKQQRELYKAELETAMHGLRMGAEYSYRPMGTIGTQGATKHGVRYLIGYRFTRCWYVGGIVGVDLTTPFTISRDGYYDQSLNYSISRKDKVYIPVMADIRLYFNVARVSTYLYTNVGAEFSSTIAAIGLLGLGFDIHTVKDQCVNLSLGVGLGSWESAEGNGIGGVGISSDPNYMKMDGFAFNLKIGYSF